MNNRYNSITETLKAVVVTPTVLSTFGSVPGQITVPASNPSADTPFFGTAEVGIFRSLFDIRDIPNILTVGFWSNVADGLAPVYSPSNLNPYVRLKWVGINAGGAAVGTPMAEILTYYPITMNRQELQNFFRTFSAPLAMTLLRNNVAAGAVATSIVVEYVAPWVFDAYSMDAAWNAASASFEFQLEVEHTFPMLAP